MKLYLSIALLLGSLIAIGIGYETKKIRVKRSAMRKPHGFITIEMDNDSPSWGSSGWSSGGSGWSGGGSSGWGSSKSSGWYDGGMRMSIKINKKIDLGRILGMMNMEPDDGWGDDSSSGWGSPKSSGWGGSSGGYGNSGGGYSSNGWSYGSSNGYDGGSSGYRRSRAARRSRS